MMRPWLLPLAVVLSGCVNVAVARVGERFPPNPPSCDLDFTYGDLGKAMQLMATGYVQVGSITVIKGGDSFDEPMKERIRPEACKLGGDVVMMAGSSEGSFTTSFSYVSIMVLRRKAEPLTDIVTGTVKAP